MISSIEHSQTLEWIYGDWVLEKSSTMTAAKEAVSFDQIIKTGKTHQISLVPIPLIHDLHRSPKKEK